MVLKTTYLQSTASPRTHAATHRPCAIRCHSVALALDEPIILIGPLGVIYSRRWLGRISSLRVRKSRELYCVKVNLPGGVMELTFRFLETGFPQTANSAP